MHIHSAIKFITPGDFLENILVPGDDVADLAGVGKVDHMPPEKQLVGGDVDKAGGFSKALPGGDHADIAFSHAAARRFLKDPQGASFYQFFSYHY
jgi:hypothetical protein